MPELNGPNIADRVERYYGSFVPICQKYSNEKDEDLKDAFAAAGEVGESNYGSDIYEDVNDDEMGGGESSRFFGNEQSQNDFSAMCMC